MSNAKKRLLRIGSERGQATIEFALLLPVLLVLVLAILDFGKAFNYWIDETHLANAAARWAVVNAIPGSASNSCAGRTAASTIGYQVEMQADTNELRCGGASIGTAPGAPHAGVCITFSFPGGGTGLVGQPVQAQVQATYNWLKFLTGPLGISGLSSKTMTATATMRLEAQYDATAYTAGAAC